MSSKQILEEILGQALGGKARILGMGTGELSPNNDDEDGVTLMPEAQFEELHRHAERYQNGCPFRPGDEVTPQEIFGMRGAGQPHVVLEVLPAPVWMKEHKEPRDTSSAQFGRKVDMRVLCYVSDEHIASFWCESYQYERYMRG